jgi:gamma-glutamyl-gamma-aminobutyrate hydrolase PuuD
MVGLFLASSAFAAGAVAKDLSVSALTKQNTTEALSSPRREYVRGVG